MNHFVARAALLSYSSCTAPNGARVSADRIFAELMQRKEWFTSRSPAHMVPGDTVVFYQARKGIRGFATVNSVQSTVPADNVRLASLGLSFLKIRFELSSVQQFTEPLSLRPYIEQLSFIRNKVYWGHSLRSTPRWIDGKDFYTILSAAKDERVYLP